MPCNFSHCVVSLLLVVVVSILSQLPSPGVCHALAFNDFEEQEHVVKTLGENFHVLYSEFIVLYSEFIVLYSE